MCLLIMPVFNSGWVYLMPIFMKKLKKRLSSMLRHLFILHRCSLTYLHSFTLSLRYLLREKKIEVIELIPPALNTDLGDKGIHDFAPPVTGFIDAVFDQLKQGKQEITFGFSEAMLKAGPEELQKAFTRM